MGHQDGRGSPHEVGSRHCPDSGWAAGWRGNHCLGVQKAPGRQIRGQLGSHAGQRAGVASGSASGGGAGKAGVSERHPINPPIRRDDKRICLLSGLAPHSPTLIKRKPLSPGPCGGIGAWGDLPPHQSFSGIFPGLRSGFPSRGWEGRIPKDEEAP